MTAASRHLQSQDEGPSLFAVYAREAAGSVRVKALLAHLRAHAPRPAH